MTWALCSRALVQLRFAPAVQADERTCVRMRNTTHPSRLAKGDARHGLSPLRQEVAPNMLAVESTREALPYSFVLCAPIRCWLQKWNSVNSCMSQKKLFVTRWCLCYYQRLLCVYVCLYTLERILSRSRHQDRASPFSWRNQRDRSPLTLPRSFTHLPRPLIPLVKCYRH